MFFYVLIYSYKVHFFEEFFALLCHSKIALFSTKILSITKESTRVVDMSVNPAVCLNIEKGDGIAKSFVYTFRSFKNNNNKYTLKVSILEKDGTLTDKVESTDYTVNRNRQGGNITFNTAPPIDSNVIIESNVEFVQNYNFTSGQQVDGYILTNALDEIAMKILQLKCKSDNSVKINLDPITGKAFPISIDKPDADKILTYDHTATKVIASSYSVDDLKALSRAIDNALAAANAANTTAQQNLAATNQAKTDAANSATQAAQANQAVQTTNTQFQTDSAAVIQQIAQGKTDISALTTQAGQDAQAAAASKTAAQTSETNINNLYNTNIKPVSDLVKAPVNPDELLVGGAGVWTKQAGMDFFDKMFKQKAGNAQLLWNDGGVVKGIDKADLGGGGNTGTGVDLKTVFDGQPDGSALIADAAATDKYSLQRVPAIKTPDPSKAGQAVVINAGGTGFDSAVVPVIGTANPANAGKLVGYNSAGDGFVATDPPDLQGKGADYTVPTTIATAPNKLKQLEAMIADPAASPSRAGKIGRVSSDGAHIEYEDLPKADQLIVLNKADSTDTIDTGVTIPAGQAVETFKNLQLHFDVANDKWEILLGDNAMGGSTIPTPPTTPLSYLATEKLANGVGIKWDPLNFEKPASAADDGKVWAWSQANSKFELVTPMADTPLTRSLTGETGISGAPEITKTAALTISIEPCILQFSDPLTYATISHDLPQTSYTLTGVTNTIVWVYSDPKDNWAIKQQTTTPTLDERLGRVYLAEVEVTNSIIRSVKPIYNELSHKEYVLREIGDAIGTTTRGAKFDIVANGLKAVKDATLFSFLARRVPLTGGGVFNSSKLFFTKDSVYTAYYVKNGVVDNSASTTFLPKIYIDATGNEGTLAAGNGAVTVHYVYAPATFDTTTGNITGLYLIIGNSLYDSISSAKEDIMTADSAAEVPAFISRNCALVAKIFVRYDAVDTNPATFAIINYANLSSKSTSVIHSSVLPDTSGVVDGALLQVKNENYMFDSNVRPLIADTPIADGQILTVQGGKAVGTDATALGLNVYDLTDVKRKFKAIKFTSPNLAGKIIDKAVTPPSGTEFFGITKLDNKTDTSIITVTFDATIPSINEVRVLTIGTDPNDSGVQDFYPLYKNFTGTTVDVNFVELFPAQLNFPTVLIVYYL